ncbi:hypothetical protein [Vibrio owensii]|uniref:hypothetical protein n=1 Tax=Vibrio harveyi group TaxID=717610 RepID=UPI003CC58E1C
MKITILQRGGDKNDHDILESAALYYSKMLMSTRMCNTLKLRIELRATKLEAGVLGECSTENIGSKANKEFTIVMRRDEDINSKLSTLAHEMVHVAQKATNILQHRKWKSDNRYHTRWNGIDMGLSNSVPYNDRPWEKEAFALQRTMFNAFACHHNEHSVKEAQYKEQFNEKLKKHVVFERKKQKLPELAM